MLASRLSFLFDLLFLSQHDPASFFIAGNPIFPDLFHSVFYKTGHIFFSFYLIQCFNAPCVEVIVPSIFYLSKLHTGGKANHVKKPESTVSIRKAKKPLCKPSTPFWKVYGCRYACGVL